MLNGIRNTTDKGRLNNDARKDEMNMRCEENTGNYMRKIRKLSFFVRIALHLSVLISIISLVQSTDSRLIKGYTLSMERKNPVSVKFVH